LSYSPIVVGAKIIRIILGLLALFIIVNFLFTLFYNPYSFVNLWQGTLVSLIVVWILYWLVGKAEFGWKRHQEDRAQRLRGLIDTYGKITLTDLSAKMGMSTHQTEDLIAHMRAEGKINARIEGGNVISESGTPAVSHFCTNCGKPLSFVNGRWWCESCKIQGTAEAPSVKEVIKEREVVMVACKHCGARNLQTATFCSRCGAAL
jgi:ribosomal protein L40E